MNEKLMLLVIAAVTGMKNLRDIAETDKNMTLKNIVNTTLSDLADILDKEVEKIRHMTNAPCLTNIEIDTLSKGKENFIPVIKMLRNRTGIGLADGKKYVEDWMMRNWGYKYQA